MSPMYEPIELSMLWAWYVSCGDYDGNIIDHQSNDGKSFEEIKKTVAIIQISHL